MYSTAAGQSRFAFWGISQLKKILSAAAVAAAAFGMSGCATVMNGTSQPVTFKSEPDGATVKIIQGMTCVTPCDYEMKRGKDSMVTVERSGYKPVSVYIQSRTGGATFGNIIAGGIIGGVVDGSNGASNHLYPNPVYVRLVRADSNEEPVLLDKKGEVISTVAEYNAKVEADVLKGLEGQGIYAKGQAKSGVAAATPGQ
jgi:hypothetical protein